MILLRTQKLSLVLCTGFMLLAQPVKAMPVISFDFDPNAVAFNAGGIIDFDIDNAFDDFTILSQNGGVGGLTNLDGEVDGSFIFTAAGDVTTTGGAMRIDDGAGETLTGDLDFSTISFIDSSFQFVSVSGQVDFNSYAGSNDDLEALATFGSPYEISLDFLYTGLTTLANLADFGAVLPAVQVNAQGTVALPEPRSLALLGLGILSIGFYGVRRRQQSKRKRSAQGLEHCRALDATN